MYIIIVGAGDIGTPLIEIATKSGNEVVVVERDAQKADEIASEHDCLVLNDDATTKETLRDAGAERADAIISTTDQDATNVMVCLLAKEFEIPAITSVVHSAEHMNLFRQIGVNTMENPQQLIAGRSPGRPSSTTCESARRPKSSRSPSPRRRLSPGRRSPKPAKPTSSPTTS
jgi:trk system potassium uptake protein TrkA